MINIFHQCAAQFNYDITSEKTTAFLDGYCSIINVKIVHVAVGRITGKHLKTVIDHCNINKDITPLRSEWSK